jgi:hypothetical protein
MMPMVAAAETEMESSVHHGTVPTIAYPADARRCT